MQQRITPIESVQWIHGAQDCAHSTDSALQVYEFDEDTFVIRISKCFSFEGNFIYLMFGGNRAILFDTGPRPDETSSVKILPVRDCVDTIISRWAESRRIDAINLVVAHTHGHGDHVFWDGQFSARPNTTVVHPTLQSVKNFFGLPNWPEGQATLSLGSRELTIFPIPGHEETHIAIYDNRTKMLLTGDMLYPGELIVEDWAAYRESAARLAEFAKQNEIALVLGAHIEMKSTPRELYTVGTTYQPHEHSLPLKPAHIYELHRACEAMADSPRTDVHSDFIIQPL